MIDKWKDTSDISYYYNNDITIIIIWRQSRKWLSDSSWRTNATRKKVGIFFDPSSLKKRPRNNTRYVTHNFNLNLSSYEFRNSGLIMRQIHYKLHCKFSTNLFCLCLCIGVKDVFKASRASRQVPAYKDLMYVCIRFLSEREKGDHWHLSVR